MSGPSCCGDQFSLANCPLMPIHDGFDSIMMAAVLEREHSHDLEGVRRSSSGLHQGHLLPDFELVRCHLPRLRASRLWAVFTDVAASDQAKRLDQLPRPVRPA